MMKADIEGQWAAVNRLSVTLSDEQEEGGRNKTGRDESYGTAPWDRGLAEITPWKTGLHGKDLRQENLRHFEGLDEGFQQIHLK